MQMISCLYQDTTDAEKHNVMYRGEYRSFFFSVYSILDSRLQWLQELIEKRMSDMYFVLQGKGCTLQFTLINDRVMLLKTS